MDVLSLQLSTYAVFIFTELNLKHGYSYARARSAFGHMKKISHRHCIGPLRGSSSPFSALSRRGLSPIKPVYDPDRPDGRLNLTASAFNGLGQYTSSPGRRGYCYAELAVFFPSGGRNHRQYSLRLPTEGWPG